MAAAEEQVRILHMAVQELVTSVAALEHWKARVESDPETTDPRLLKLEGVMKAEVVHWTKMAVDAEARAERDRLELTELTAQLAAMAQQHR